MSSLRRLRASKRCTFKLKPLAQTYLRKNAQIVRYESAGVEFQRDLQINRKGVVIKFPGLWEAEAIE